MTTRKQTIQWLTENRQYNDYKKTDNTMTKRKGRTLICKMLHRKLKKGGTRTPQLTGRDAKLFAERQLKYITNNVIPICFL